jgi:dissimilatory sulfite reductase (desulfoviridin) alpha/beta subunit
MSEYDRWARTSVVPQRQPGFSTVQIKVVRGDLTPEQFRGLADIMRKYSGGYARTTVHQNLVLRWVRDETTFECGARCRARARRRRRGRDQRRRELPGTTPASSASRALWG